VGRNCSDIHRDVLMSTGVTRQEVQVEHQKTLTIIYNYHRLVSGATCGAGYSFQTPQPGRYRVRMQLTDDTCRVAVSQLNGAVETPVEMVRRGTSPPSWTGGAWCSVDERF
jgi:hypothetical protein